MAIIDTGKDEVNLLIDGGQGFHGGETWIVAGHNKFTSTEILNLVFDRVSVIDDHEMNRGDILVLTPTGNIPCFSIGDDTDVHITRIESNMNNVLFAYAEIKRAIGSFISVGHRLSMVIIMDFHQVLGNQAMSNEFDELAKRLRTYNVGVGSTCILVNPLSTAASMIAKMSGEFFLNQLPGKGYHGGSMRLEQAVDGEIFVNPDAEKLRVVVGKNRFLSKHLEERGESQS